MKDATIIDVAQSADVSPATVSRVLNDTVSVSDDKEERVKKAVRELNYKPNKFAHALRKERSNVIGIIVPDLSNPFFATLIRGAEAQLHKTEKAGLIGDTNSNPEKEGEYVDTLLREQVDGVILISSGQDCEKLSEILENDIPMVAADRDPELNRVSKVLADNYRGGLIAGRHLINKGYEKLGFIKGPSKISSAVSRFEGFKEAIENHDKALEDRFVYEGGFSFDTGRKAAKDLLENIDNQQLPFGLVATDDLIALGVMREVKNAGLRIPQDFGIVGFDNILMAKLITPSLTTISIPAYKIGEEAAKILLDNIKRKSEGLHYTITEKTYEVNLVPRKSTDLE